MIKKNELNLNWPFSLRLLKGLYPSHSQVHRVLSYRTIFKIFQGKFKHDSTLTLYLC